MKLAIIGSRNISAVNIGAHLAEVPEVIISGGARGVDTLAAQYAESNGIPLQVFKPNYKAHAQGAPIRRNETICKECTHLLAFWDGKSRGTAYTINYAKKLGRHVEVVLV